MKRTRMDGLEWRRETHTSCCSPHTHLFPAIRGIHRLKPVSVSLLDKERETLKSLAGGDREVEGAIYIPGRAALSEGEG